MRVLVDRHPLLDRSDLRAHSDPKVWIAIYKDRACGSRAIATTESSSGIDG
jgi:hypothetical protein